MANLRAARERIEQLPSVRSPVLASAVYETEPVNCERGAGKFLNAVLEIQIDGTAPELLAQLRRIENASERPAVHARNASRTLDLDLLYFGDLTINSPDLELPHPRMVERRFVLEPLADIRADLVLPDQSETVFTLLAKLPATTPLVRIASEW